MLRGEGHSIKYIRKAQILQDIVCAATPEELVCVMDIMQKAGSIPFCPRGVLGHVLRFHEDSNLYLPVHPSLQLDC